MFLSSHFISLFIFVSLFFEAKDFFLLLLLLDILTRPVFFILFFLSANETGVSSHICRGGTVWTTLPYSSTLFRLFLGLI